MNVLIIEDEYHAQVNLARMLCKLDHSIEIVDKLATVKNAIQWLSTNRADLIFMDVHLADGNSFSIFDEVNVRTPLIFTTAYNEYAVDAFQYNGIDFLSKPFTEEELQPTLERAKRFVWNNKIEQRFSDLLELVGDAQIRRNKLGFPTIDGMEFVNIKEITHIESNNGYTHIYLQNESFLCTIKKLSKIEELLEGHSFYRIHRSFLVNIDYIRRYKRTVGESHILLDNGQKLPVARRKKEPFISYLKNY